MKRRRPHITPRLSRDAERLTWLAAGLAESASRTEDSYWEAELQQHLLRLLREGQEEPLTLALDRLQEHNSRAYDELADLLEAATEGDLLDTPDGPRRALLIALPIMAWSRYAIPTRRLPGEALAALRVQLSAHVLANGARLALSDYLYSPDQLPYGYAQTRKFAEVLWQHALAERDYREDAGQLAQANHYISDTRYLLAAIVVPVGQPVFRWNEPDGSRAAALEAWRAQAAPSLQGTLAGCGYELLLPDAYFSAWRQADREHRAYTLRASVAFLQATFNLTPSHFQAVAAPFYERRLQEWRIGFGRIGGEETVFGVIWPLLGAEDEGTDIAGEIERILKTAGVGEVLILDQRFALDYCEDCGAPLYPNAEGETTHAEMPEEEGDSTSPVQLH